ncbi:MAG: LicD family protein [Rikenellaceae bacterium]
MKQRNRHLYDTQCIQKRLLTILSSFDKVCREHNLKYYLWAGTQLGAVRHEGFIPWDDDADIAMPRADYQRLLKHADKWLPAPLNLANLHTTEGYPHYFARVQDVGTTMIIRKHLNYVEGLHVDIFPLDNIPNNRLSRSFHFMRLSIHHRMLYYASRSPKKDKKRYKAAFYKLLQKVIDRKKVLLSLDRLMQRYNKKETLYCADSFYGSCDYVEKATLGKQKKYLFEGVELYGVEFADKYLSDKYGNYMVVPPENARVQHSVDFMDLDLPFAQFDINSI